MKIKTLVAYGTIECGSIVEALISPDGKQAVTFDKDSYIQFYGQGAFEIVEVTRLMSEVLDKVSHSIEYKCPESSYTLEELKALKELLK